MSDATTETSRPVAPSPVQVRLWTSYATLLRWQLAQIGPMLPLIVLIQALLAGGIVIGFGFLIPDIDADTAMFLSTGTPSILLLTMGLVIVPQGVARARTDGTFTYMRALPMARPLLLVADLTVWAAIAAPSLAMGVLVAWLRYEIPLDFDWPVLVTASLLVTTMATAVGYAIAVSLQPMLAQLVSQVLVFFVLLFSPITFPAAQLPSWFQSVHDVLPVRPGADLIRAGLVSDHVDASGRDLAVLALWCLLGIAVSIRALVRRG